MCGIAGYSVAPHHQIDHDALVRLLIAGLAERGEDACGFAIRRPDGEVTTRKKALPPHLFLNNLQSRISGGITDAMVHVRDHTKGQPSHHGNNHPIRHGRIIGVHNGIIQNDDALFERMNRPRAENGMTVDSEAIFMLLNVLESPDQAFPLLQGSYSTSWWDLARHDLTFIARGRGRPLVLGRARGLVVFASTHESLAYLQKQMKIKLRTGVVPEETMLTVRHGQIINVSDITTSPFTESTVTEYDPHANHARLARSIAEQQIRKRNIA